MPNIIPFYVDADSGQAREQRTDDNVLTPIKTTQKTSAELQSQTIDEGDHFYDTDEDRGVFGPLKRYLVGIRDTGKKINTVADLEGDTPSWFETLFSATPKRDMLGYNSVGDGGGGQIYWDPDQDKQNHNAVSVFSPTKSDTTYGDTQDANWYNADGTDTGTGCWIRDIGNDIDVRLGGVAEDSDQLTSLTALVDVFGIAGGASSILADNQYNIIIPEGLAIQTSSTINVPYNNLNIQIKGELLYTGTANETAISIGNSSISASEKDHRLNVVRDTQSDWASEDSVAVEIINHEESDIYLDKLDGFTVGIKCFASNSRGFVYNKIKTKFIINCQISYLLTNDTGGWVNENTFFGGRHAVNSSVNDTLNRYGAVIRSEDSSYINHNNNLFFRQSMELRDHTGINSIAYRFEGTANHNTIYKPRVENMTHLWQLEDSANNNIFDTGFNDSTNDILDNSDNASNYLINQGLTGVANTNINKLVASFPDLERRSNYYNSSEAVYSDGLGFVDSGGATINRVPLASSGVSIESDYLNINSTRGIGIEINTDGNKDFLVKRDVKNGQPGRVIVRCYDSSGTIITDQSVIKSPSFSDLTFNSNFGGVFRLSSDINQDVMFKVSDDVDRIWVGVIGGTDNANINGLSIYTKGDGESPNWRPGHGDQYGKGFVAQELTDGVYEEGDIVWRDRSIQGNNVGWINRQSGEFGTGTEPIFEPFGQAGYRENAGDPSGSVTPNFVGEELLDTTNTVWYKSIGLTDTDWVALNS